MNQHVCVEGILEAETRWTQRTRERLLFGVGETMSSEFGSGVEFRWAHFALELSKSIMTNQVTTQTRFRRQNFITMVTRTRELVEFGRHHSLRIRELDDEMRSNAVGRGSLKTPICELHSSEIFGMHWLVVSSTPSPDRTHMCLCSIDALFLNGGVRYRL